MEGQIFIILIAIVVGLAFIIHAHHRARARSHALAGWAAAKGLYFHREKVKTFDDEHPVLRCLRRGNSRYAYNIASGEWGEYIFTSFDYHYATGSGKNRRSYHFSGVFLRPQFPLHPLIVRPEGLFDKFKAGFGFNDIDFESAEFSKRFYVTAVDKRFAYDVITPRTMEFLLMSARSPLQLSFECDHELLCVVSKKLLDIPDIERAYTYGKTILDGIPDFVRTQHH